MRSTFTGKNLRDGFGHGIAGHNSDAGRAINRRTAKRRGDAVTNAVLPLEKRLLFSAFYGGDLVVERIGAGGSATLSSASAPIYLDEYNPSGVNQATPNNTVSLPSSSGAALISDSGSSTTAGQLSLATNGQYLAIPGYQAPSGVTAIAGTTPANDPREIDAVDSTGSVVQTLTSSTFYFESNIRSAATDGNGNFWTAGTVTAAANSSTGGINYWSSGGNNNVETGSATYQYNTRVVNVFNVNGTNQLYYGTGSATSGIYSVGTGTPTSGGQTGTLLVADPTSGNNPYAFSISPNGQTIYLADDSSLGASGGGILKFAQNTSGGFVYQYTLGAFTGETAGDLGLTVDWTGTTPVIYATTGDTTGQKLFKVVDNGSVATAKYTVLATAATNTAFRGVAFVPSTGLADPTVVSVNPNVGATAGGTNVTISGSNFNTVTGVYFGSTAAASYTVVNSTTITAVSPAGSAGTIDVTVNNSTGASTTSAADTFNYTVSPVITSISPTSGSTTGGTSVIISGSNFAGVNNVSFGSVAAASFNYNAANSTITAITPSESAGSVLVTVTTPGGTATSPTQFTFAAPPTISGLNLSTGTSVVALAPGIDSGGNRVVIYGANLSTVTSVSFGSVPATTFAYNTSLGAIIADSPAESVGTVNVVLTNPGGTSTTSSADQFTYMLTTIAGAESPTVIANDVITIDSNPEIEQVLCIAGQTYTDGDFQTQTFGYTQFFIQDTTANGGGGLSVFGNHDVTGAASLPGDYQPAVGNTVALTGTYAPYQQLPEVDAITAINTSGSALAASAYPPVPVLTTIPIANVAAPLPSSINGHIVQIKGVYLSGLTSPLDFNSSTGTITDTMGNSMSFYYSTTYNQAVLANLNVPYTVPIANLVDVTGYVDVATTGVTEFNPISIVSPSTIAPIISSSNPAQGPLGGTNSVTIMGYGFTGTTSVSFGGTAGTNINVSNDSTIIVTAPAHAAGSVSLTVTNENGMSNSISYLYTTAPVVSGVSPGGESTSGGQPVVITGTGFSTATNVSFGSVVLGAGSFTINSSTQITVTSAPAESAGSVDVTVTAPAPGGGYVTSSTSSADKFIYDTIPTISVSPNTGADNGGYSVVISGNSLLGTYNVSFGSVAATSFNYNATNGTITAVVPPGTPGTVNVTVTNYAGTSTITSSDQFTYTPTTVFAAQQLATGTFVTIDSNPVISAILSQPGLLNGESYPYYAFLINDGTGSEDIFYNPAKQSASVGSFIPIVGNTIKITGEVSPFNQIPEFGGTGNNVITYIANTGTAAVPAPIPETVSAVNITTLPQGTGFGGHLITLSNVTVTSSGTTTATSISTVLTTGSSGNVTLTANDSTGSMALYYYETSYLTANEQFYGSTFPAGPETLTGFVYVFTSGSTHTPEFVPVLDNSDAPSWLAPSSLVGINAVYNPGQKTLYVNGAATITGDPGAATSPAITSVPASNTNTSNFAIGAVLNVNASAGTVVHVGSISLGYDASMTVNASSGAPVVLQDAGAFTIGAGSTLNLNNNEMDLNTSSGATSTVLFGLLSQGYDNGPWNGTGIISTAAANDTTYLTALGYIINDTGANTGANTGTPLYTTMGTAAVSDGDTLVKYTYYGDTNLDGKVDGSDYSNIDNGFINHLTGWFNGDFNYDGVVDGSDYTLIDNAFNTQGAAFSPAAEIAGQKNTAVSTPAATTTASDLFSKKKLKHSLIAELEVVT
jgi:hypothetical protein